MKWLSGKKVIVNFYSCFTFTFYLPLSTEDQRQIENQWKLSNLK